MNDSNTFFSRVGNWFKNSNGDNGARELKLQPDSQHQIVTRSSFFRPWARRDAAIQNLQSGFVTLTDLMSAIKENLERQDQRHEELISTLQQLPAILQSVPESSKLQSETLQAIHQQIESQNAQQSRLGEILTRICEADAARTSTIGSLRERIDSLAEHDEAIASNLNSVGAAMSSLSENSAASANLLRQLNQNSIERDRELEKILHRQGVRFATLLSVAIFLAIAALGAVGTMAYLGYELLNKIH